MLEDLQALYKALEDDHNNWELWGLLGDCYEDMGSELAKGIRWMCENQKRPYRRGYLVFREQGWLWFDSVTQTNDYESDLPIEIFDMLKLPEHANNHMKLGANLQLATEALCEAINSKVHSDPPSQ